MITMMTYLAKMADLVIKVYGGLVKRDHASMAWMSQGFDSLILHQSGGIAQLGEHLICIQGVVGSNPSTSTKYVPVVQLDRIRVS